MKQSFVIVDEARRRRAMTAVAEAPEGYVVEVKPKTRSLDQNAKFHAICSELARSGLLWAGKKRDAAAWKVLLVSGHATVTKEGSEMVPGLESEYVNLRESTALMSKHRGSSLIEYAQAFVAHNIAEVA